VRPYLRVTGEILVTCGVIVALFIAYMWWGTAARESSAQRNLTSELRRQWVLGGPQLALFGSSGTALGRPIALLRIPAFGPTWQFAIVQGTGLAQLALGPGHVPGTAMPGQVGNFAVAGHRVTAGNPFWSELQLRPGDLAFVTTARSVYTYRVSGPPVWVAPTDTAMLAPVPGYPGQRPRRALMTLITCDPPWTGTSRVIVTAVLIRTAPRRAEA
jgi:sortase A